MYMSDAKVSRKLKRDVKNTKNIELKKDEDVLLKWENNLPRFTCLVREATGERIVVLTRNLHLYVKNMVKAPSVYLIEKWVDEGFCKSVLGKKVESDGWDDNGSPSWMLALGLI